MQAPHKYPLGRAVFRDIREEGLLYVDKTQYVWDMTHAGGKYFFLSRPRRFGKSLLCSTLESYFQGERDLFDGLAVGELEQTWEQHPVLHVDLSSVKATTVGGLREALGNVLSPLENRWGCSGSSSSFTVRISQLIDAAYEQTGEEVVFLVDEYDSPLLTVIHDPVTLADFREVMREFYSPLKGHEAKLRFVFLTGITKFSQLSIFSELNNIVNISMTSHYAGICGITEDELLGSMRPDVEWLADKNQLEFEEMRARLKERYDGYHFCKESPDIYNPFSVLSAFSYGELGNYWFVSGTPTSLVNVLDHFDFDIPQLEGFQAQASSFDAPTEQMDSPVPLMYQGGYLTIKGYDPRFDFYTLGVPNGEVSQGLYESLLPRYTGASGIQRDTFLGAFLDALNQDDIARALAQLRSFLAGIPFDLAPKNEKEFQTVLFIVWKVVGAKVATEVRTATGSIDVTIESPEKLYVLELKYDKSAKAALEQIDEKGYLIPFESSSKRLVKVGVNFSSKERTIDDWLIAEA